MGHKGPENTRKDESPRQSTVTKRHTESKASRSPEQIPPQNQRSFHRLQRVKTDKAKNKSGGPRCPSRWRCHGQSRSLSEPLGLPALTPGASVSASRRMARALPTEQTQSCGEPPTPSCALTTASAGVPPGARCGELLRGPAPAGTTGGKKAKCVCCLRECLLTHMYYFMHGLK